MKMAAAALWLTWTASAWAQALERPVSLAELQDASIENAIVFEQVERSAGREQTRVTRHDLTLVFRASDTLEGTYAVTMLQPRHREGNPQAFSASLGKTGEARLFGSGRALFTFSDGTLTQLRTLKAGAFKREISFQRSPEGFTCAAMAFFAHEGGGDIVFSGYDGSDITLVSAKQVSSSCRVTRRP